MRLTTVLLIACLMQVSAASLAQKVTLNERNALLTEVLREIRKQSGFDIYADGKDFPKDQKVTVVVKDASVEEALSAAFKGLDLTYKIEGNTIAVRPKEGPSFLERVIARFQAIDVKGKVVDSLGNGLAGATVSIKNGKGSTSTDAAGDFLLKNVDEGAVLVVSYLGYVTREQSVSKDFTYIILQQSKSKLDEVQIIAYGATSRRLNTGNVVSVKAADIERQPVNNPILALQGRVPGLTIEQATGFSGSGVKIRIQGQNSMTGGNDPFFVIDGVPYVSQLLPNLGNILGRPSGENGNPLAFINPADIESIDVLKDADATAIYGARAANGAILITTKKGKAGKMRVSVNSQTGYGQVAERLKLLNTTQYIEMRREAKANDNAAVEANDYDINGTWSEQTNHDWQKELLGGKAKFYDEQVTVSGGSPNVQYLMGAGYHRETTVFPTDLGDNKVDVRFNINAVSDNRRFSATFSGSFLNDNNRLPNVDLTRNAMELSPNAPDLRKPDGSLNWGTNDQGFSTFGFNHPLAKITALYKVNTDNLLANAGFKYYILKTLSLKTNLGYNALSSNELTTNPASIWAPEYSSFVTRSAKYGDSKIKTWLIEPQLTFDHQFSNSKLSALLGATVQQTTSNRREIDGSGYTSDLVLENVGAATSVSIPPYTTIVSDYKYNAGFFRVNYNLEDKYILNLSGRRDGSSRYGDKDRFHNFGAVGAAWLFSNEQFFSSLSKILDFGKLRASYGTTGNDQIGDYTYLSLYSYNTPPVPYQGGASLIQNKLTNPYIHWEDTRKFSLGLDLGFFADRILLTGNYFINKSSNLINSAQLPSMAGPRSLDVNLPAVVRNSGVEVLLNTVNVSKKDFKWSSYFNMTVSRNILKRFDGLSTSIYASTYVLGQPLNLVKAYRFKGVDPGQGIYLYADKDGNLTNDPNSDPANKTVLINTDPKFFGGFSNSISYKGIQLDFLLQFVKQVAPLYLPGSPGYMINEPVSVLERWQKPGDVKPVQKFGSTDARTLDAYYNLGGSDANYVDGSYIRLKNASLSWALPLSLRKRLSLENGRIFINCQNLFTVTSYKGLDPETRSSVSLPPLRVFTAGFQLAF